MKFPGTINLKLPLFIFVVLLLLVLTDIFYVEGKSDSETIDKVFYLIIHISFWISTAFLFNMIINKFFWGGLSKIPIGNSALNKVRDFLGTLTYVIVAIIILVGYFDFEYNYNLIAVGVIVSVAGMFFRSHILSSFKSTFLATSSALNIGDEIKLTAINSDTIIFGKVDSVDKRNLQLINEDGNILTIPQESLDDFVIENYWGNENESRFKINVTLPFSVKINRAKRILLSAVKTTYYDLKINSINEPEVISTEFLTDSIEYSVYFWLNVKRYSDVGKLKDVIITNIKKYLDYSGVNFSTEVLSSDTEIDYQTVVNKKINKVLKQNEIFDSLNNEEITEINNSIIIREYNLGEIVIKENESGDSMFIVIEGLLNVSVTSEDGRYVTVGRLTPKEYFGEMSLMTGEKRSATVSCETDVLLYEITKENISKIIENRKDLIDEFGEVISRRTQSNVELLEKYEKSKHTVLNEIVNKIKRFFKHN